MDKEKKEKEEKEKKEKVKKEMEEEEKEEKAQKEKENAEEDRGGANGIQTPAELQKVGSQQMLSPSATGKRTKLFKVKKGVANKSQSSFDTSIVNPLQQDEAAAGAVDAADTTAQKLTGSMSMAAMGGGMSALGSGMGMGGMLGALKRLPTRQELTEEEDTSEVFVL